MGGSTIAQSGSWRWRLAMAALALGGLVMFGAGNAALAASGPTSQDLLNAGKDSSNWILPNYTYDNDRYVQQSEISTGNVSQLQKAWTFTVPDNSPMESIPVEWHGTVYVTSAHDSVYALDAATGKLKWEFVDHPHVIAFAANRGVGILNGKVFIATLDGHLIALDAATGKKVWDVLEVHDPKNTFYTMAPLPYKGMLLLGASNGDWGGIGYLTAFNPANGHRIWEWDTIPGPGQPGHDTWSGDSWKRGGAAAWTGAAINPETNTMYLDLGNPQPDFLGTFRKGRNLYSDSMVALSVTHQAPRIKWFHQFIPHDTHDWDAVMPPVLLHGKVGNTERYLVAAGDKGGNFWILDARTGRVVHHTPVSYQHGMNTAPSLKGNYACPNTNGGVEFPGGAYDPANNTFFVPSTVQCGFWKSTPKAVYIAGQFYLGGIFPKLVGPNYGWMNAVNVSNGLFNWRRHFGLPENGGALVLSGGVVFTGELNGKFDAFDAKTGDLLWQYDTGAAILNAPATYVADGKRFVIMDSGAPRQFEVPEMPKKHYVATVTAFTLK